MWKLASITLCMIVMIALASSMPVNDESAENAEEETDENAPEYLWQFQELIKCTMGIQDIMDLLRKYNCTQCQTCFNEWNTGYLELNQYPVCQEFEGQLYTLSYEYECSSNGYARCLKNPISHPCQYETCVLDTKFVGCLQNIKSVHH